MTQLMNAPAAALPTDDEGEDLARLFGALADRTRARILRLLQQGALCTSDLAAAAGVTESCVSQHLRLLRGLRVVRSRRAGRYVFHSLDDVHVSLLITVGLAHVREEEV